jgi:hypothetical protein
MKPLVLIIFFSTSFFLASCGQQDAEIGEALEATQGVIDEPIVDDPDLPRDDRDTASEDKPPVPGDIADENPSENQCQQSMLFDQWQAQIFQQRCAKANPSQIRQVDLGNQKKDQFLSRCFLETNQSCWCHQLVRPNPASINTFRCTYGEDQVHQLIHPNESTWKHAIEAVKIVQELYEQNIETQVIYNWWRPEPYNRNVGGSASRHPFGTSVDVRFKTKSMQNRAFSELCKMRRRGRIRAIGYYQSTAIHFGIGDSAANTWGKSCP